MRALERRITRNFNQRQPQPPGYLGRSPPQGSFMAACWYPALLHDIASTYFEGDLESCPIAKRGYARDSRGDRPRGRQPQVNMSLHRLRFEKIATARTKL